jgi:hypothetical protein
MITPFCRPYFENATRLGLKTIQTLNIETIHCLIIIVRDRAFSRAEISVKNGQNAVI